MKQSYLHHIIIAGFVVLTATTAWAWKGTPSTGGAVPAEKTQHPATAPKVVAQVNGVKIMNRDLVEKMREVAQLGYRKANMTQEVALEIKKEALDKLIAEELVTQRANSQNITIPAETIKKYISNLRKRVGGEDGFQKVLLKNNLSFEELLAKTEHTLKVQQLILNEVDNKIEITEEDIKKAYEENKEEFTQQERIDIIDVIFFLDPSAPDSLKKAEDIRMKIINDHNEDPMKIEPDGTFIVKEPSSVNKDLEPELFEIALQTTPLKLSDVIIANNTLHVIKVTGYRPEITQKISEARQYIEKQLVKNRREQKIKEWIAELKQDAQIEYLDIKAE